MQAGMLSFRHLKYFADSLLVHRPSRASTLISLDLIDAGTTGGVISKKFSSEKELAKYIRRTGKVFPKDRAKKNPLLRKFLIVVGSRR